MPDENDPIRIGMGTRMAALPLPAQLSALLVLSGALEAAMRTVHLPAALMLGPMGAAVLLALARTEIAIPRDAFVFSQTIIGCMIANALPRSVFELLLHEWPVMLFSCGAVISVSFMLGLFLARRRVLPGSTAIWGAAPGAASAMVIMSEAFGADVRLVAFMQYVRVVMVALASTLVAAVSTAHVAAMPAIRWFPPLHVGFVETLGLAALGLAVARREELRIGALMVPLVCGALLNDTGLLQIELPPWLLAICYAVIGWSVGLRFTKEILLYTWGVLPQLIASVLALIGICGMFAWLLVITMHITPLTAYLATSPGGADTVAIISTSVPGVNIGFVMGLQSARLFVVILIGPPLAKCIARHVAMVK